MGDAKTKLYMRTYRPPDGGARRPVGFWMHGVESVGFVNGQPIVMVRLQDGAFEPLSDLFVTEIVERRTAARAD